MSAKSCKFVITESNVVVVPRPSSVIGGVARHRWLRNYFKQDITIASPAFWKFLCGNLQVKTLVETSGKYKVIDSKNT
jgi:hypothetical protein